MSNGIASEILDSSLKNEKNYTDEELKYNDYSLKVELEDVIDYDESYSIKNEVNNYTEIYTNDISVTEEFENKASIYEYKISSNAQ